jgi:AraC-like DNA-binding protein
VESLDFVTCLACLCRSGEGAEAESAEFNRPISVFAADWAGGNGTPRHRHECGQLLYASGGAISLWLAAGGERTLSPRDAIWIPAGIEHEIRALEAVRFRSVFLSEALAAHLPGKPSTFHATELLRAVVLRIIATDDRERDAIPLERLTAVLLDELQRQIADHEPDRVSMPRDLRLRRLCEAFLDDPGSEASVDEWASRFGTNRAALARAFRKDLGTTFSAWQREVRVQKARRRLAAGETVTRVALDLGYESLSAFTTMFKRVTGESPSARSNG